MNAENVPEILGRVRALWPEVEWGWDDRFGCALATVTKQHEARAREALAAGLPSIWSTANLAEAPASVRKLCAGTGGLLGAQLVFSAELADGTLVFCLWWPWGGGANFSARIGAMGTDELDAAIRSALAVKGLPR